MVHVLFLFPTFSIVVAVICGAAWWTLWNAVRSARGWAIAGSFMYVLIFLRQFVIPTRPIWDRYASSLLVGIIGLVVFSWPTEIEMATPSWNDLFERPDKRDVSLDLFDRHR